MRIQLDINSDELVVHANRLERISRKSLPKAIRGTLNSLAFDVKKDTMPTQAKKDFTNRRRNFFTANSAVNMARGNDLRTMQSEVGFTPSRDKSDKAVENLEQQERGGKIDRRDFIPMDEARTTKSPNRAVARRNQLRKIKNVVRVSETKGKSKGQKFILSVLQAREKGFVLTDKNLLRIKKITRGADGRWKFKIEHIYSFEKNRSVRVKATHFMEQATKKTMKKEEEIFKKEADRQISFIK